MNPRLIGAILATVGALSLSACASRALESGSDVSGASSTSAHTVAPASVSASDITACATSQLLIGVHRGSAASQTQFATVLFKNRSGVTCTLRGFPAVQLLLGGQPLGAAAEVSGDPASVVTLAVGAAAAATVTDFSSCNASASDTIRITPPGQSTSADAPVDLRGCRLVVGPVTPA